MDSKTSYVNSFSALLDPSNYRMIHHIRSILTHMTGKIAHVGTLLLANSWTPKTTIKSNPGQHLLPQSIDRRKTGSM